MVVEPQAFAGTASTALFDINVWSVPKLLVNMSGAVSVARDTSSF
jgi:hypothetical protein